ncbi:hypothetical protein M758_6G158400 [Ceratodon purpureus]|uniref:Plastid lipid-associated protein/fibrillin conserved domain-containing protein n=1 Tax=Ceratodon purpureus TaxID=3225 RepID=A0A8T0HGK8_CERPU|nr:hypothetical protein KC19_6G164900 [Ceratodon purpureus]KAG0614202.1 hypothetical protein M758_6G158400 [Ceratodon purpureus]
MAHVMMIAGASGCGVLQALSASHGGIGYVLGTSAVPLSRRVLQVTCESRTRTVWGDGEECRARGLRGEKVKAMAENSGTANAESFVVEDFSSVEDLKAALLGSLEGLNRGIFGVQNARKAEVESLLQLLEAASPSPRPTDDLDKVKGEWKLLYSTISILGSKRTKLGLRDFINLGDFVQIIDVDQGKAVNKVTFSVAGLGMLSGSFTIEASYNIVSPTRVNIKFENSTLVPEQLLSLFQKNYELLLSIFNPEGWLEITYIDDTLRIGRDDKGNVFLLERM